MLIYYRKRCEDNETNCDTIYSKDCLSLALMPAPSLFSVIALCEKTVRIAINMRARTSVGGIIFQGLLEAIAESFACMDCGKQSADIA